MIPQSAYDVDLALTGTPDDEIAAFSQAKRHRDRPIFLAWISNVFVPGVAWRRQAFGYEGKAAVIMNNCTAHTGLEVDEQWNAHEIFVCPLPRHSPSQISPLDFSTFRITK
jgi:hypothetical protein